MTEGNLLVISAPSGAGKTTILKSVLKDLANLSFSVSYTTRSPRPGEIDGRDYHFVSLQEFEKLRQANGFIEWARVHDNFYGTGRRTVSGQLARGMDLILDIDVQGAIQLKKNTALPAVFIFIAPPSMQELEHRLSSRQSESPESLKLRFSNAGRELQQATQYDYLIVNDVLEEAVTIFKAIVIAQRAAGGRALDGRPLHWPV